ncbi:Na+/H+ antiporter NhaC [Lentisphaerota bacterium WC36G]|nr:Na+/H+ antiporter NhaC [Lentisphaerae bacterium WC36]
MQFKSSKKRERKEAKLYHALIPLTFLVASLVYILIIKREYPEQADGLGPHLALFSSGIVAAGVAIFMLGYTWKYIQKGFLDTIKVSLEASIILIIIGMLVGTWILSGVVPVMIFYGLKVISPEAFLPTVVLLCTVISLASGSSWTTAATVGIAMMGVGSGLGIPGYVTAGAVISGAYMGDKMSPLSETTNLAPAMAGTDLFTHIRHMLYTTIPSYIISLILFIFIGMKYSKSNMNTSNIDLILSGLDQQFNLSPWLMLVPLCVIVIVLLKVPAIPGLALAAAIGGIAAILVQGSSLVEVLIAAQSGFTSNSGVEIIDSLLTRGGLESMLSTVCLIIFAVFFGGVMEKTKMLDAISKYILHFARNRGLLITSTVATSGITNLISGDQYISIIMPGRMFRKVYLDRGYAPENLSRTLEDAGTLLSPLIFWNTCGAYMIVTLGVSPWVYVPFCFFNLINPIVAIIYGFTGFSIKKLSPEAIEHEAAAINSH